MKKKFLILLLTIICISCNNKVGNQSTTICVLAPDIYVLDKEKPINSFTELTNLFKNKPVYIDRWATWCSPCIAEFKYNDSLHKFLDDNKIEHVYLNSDMDIQDSTFFQFITTHNLKGYHLRLNDTLKKDLSERKIFIPIIPQYMIIDKNGSVVENNAFRPSQGDTLYIQLQKYIN